MLSSANIWPTNPVATVNDGANLVAPHQAAILQHKSPISQLPTETLTSIFHWALPHTSFTSIDKAIDSWEYMRELYILRRVSKRWHDVIDGTSPFWTVLHSMLPSHVNNATIFRSASLPLTIVYGHPEELNIHDHPSPGEFLRRVVHTRSRWPAVVLDTFVDQGMSEYLGTPAPLLHTVVIRCEWDDGITVEPLELLGGQTANLRHVQVKAALLQWRTGLFSELKSLSLTEVDLMVGHVIDFLQASPDLEELCIDASLKMPTTQTSASMITLSHLKSIRLACNISASADYILQRIRLPSCLRFYVNLRGDDVDFDYSRFMDETMDPFRGMLREIHIENGGSEMSVDTGEFWWSSPTGADRRRAFSIQAFCPIGVRWVGRTLQEESGLKVEFLLLRGELVLRNLAPLRCVTSVLVEPQGYAQATRRKILRFLRRPLSPGASTPSFPCLREFLITWTNWDAQALLDMVQRRRSAFSTPTLDQPPLTIKLERGFYTRIRVPPPIIDLATVTKIRGTEGVECFQFVGELDADGTLAITWNEETSEPTRG